MIQLKRMGFLLILVFPGISYADGDAHLAEKMSNLQYFSHKTALSIDHKNKDLAEFYAHELEEYIEDAATVKFYDGHEIGKMINSILMPSFEQFESALKEGDWKKASARFDDFLTSCNTCHVQTEHSFVNIQRRKDNPFMQSFEAEKRTTKSKKN